MNEPQPLIWTPELIERFWEYRLQKPEEYFSFVHRQALLKLVRRQVISGKRILDFGCGPGFLGQALLRNGFLVAFADLSKDALEDLTRNLGDADGFLGSYDPRQLTTTSLKFDCVLAIELFEHLDDSALESILDLFRQRLERDGIIIITTPNAEDLSREEVYCPVSNVFFHRWQHVRRWDTRSLASYLEKHSFRVRRVYTTDFSIRPQRLIRYARVLQHRVLRQWHRLPHLVAIATVDS